MSRARAAILLFVGLLAASGCTRSSLPTSYGRRTGPSAGDSINGTAVLADMFKAAGHHVESRRALSRKLQNVQTIVWFPDNFNPPDIATCNWLATWLAVDSQRTLIYVNRDFDAEIGYWKRVLPTAPPAQQIEINSRIAEAQFEFDAELEEIKTETDCPWFSLDTEPKRRAVVGLSGPWSDGVDASKVKIELNTRLKPSSDDKVLLRSDKDILVCRLQPDEMSNSGGSIILVANGSFLVNLSLVEHEHRKLAGKLVDSVAPYGDVVFLESGKKGPRIGEEKLSGAGLEVLSVYPLNAILLHLAVLGIIFSFARFPMFGTPVDPKADSASDFGKHVGALGELLAKTHDRAYAHEKLKVWREAKIEKRSTK